MPWVESVRVALEALAANKLRSFLTVLGVIIGVGAVIGVVSFVQGLQQLVSREMEGVGATYVLVMPNWSNDPSEALRNASIRLTYQDGLEMQEKVDGVVGVSPLVQESAPVTAGGRTRTSTVMAVGADYQEINNHYVDRGRFLTSLDMERRKRVAIVGTKVATELGLGEDPRGEALRIGGGAYTIVGIMEEKGRALGQDYDDVVVIPFTTSEDQWGQQDQLILQVRAADPRAVDRVKEGIEEFLRQKYPLAEGERPRHQVVLQKEMLESINKVFGSFTAVMGGVVGFSLLVGGIGIMNIMLVSVTERTREIGLRKAVGATTRQITLQFLVEAVTLSLVGGLLGVGMGWGLGTLGSMAMARFLVPDYPPAVVPVWAFGLAFGFCTAIGVGFGLYPAVKAGRLDPIEALRYE